MVRSYWIGPVVVALAVTGFAISQSVPPTVQPKEHTITVEEADKPALKCKVLKTWRQPDGHKAYLVQALTTAEFITIAETTDMTGSKAVATNIYHWGQSQSPPAGTPAVPNNALLVGDPLPNSMTTTMSSGMPMRVVRPEPPLTPPVMAPNGKWPSAFAQTPADAEPAKSPAPAMTKLPETKPLAPSTVVATPSPIDRKSVVAAPTVPPLASVPSTPGTAAPKPPETKPLPPLAATPATAIPKAPETKPLPPLPVIAIAKAPATSLPPLKPASATVSTPSTPATPTVEKPIPGDWRESWGKVDTSNNGVVPPKPAPGTPAKPATATNSTTKSTPPSGLNPLQASDPLANPDRYVKLPSEIKNPPKPANTVMTPLGPTTTVVSAPVPPSPPPLVTPRPALTPLPVATTSAKSAPEKPVVQVAVNTVSQPALPPLPPLPPPPPLPPLPGATTSPQRPSEKPAAQVAVNTVPPSTPMPSVPPLPSPPTSAAKQATTIPVVDPNGTTPPGMKSVVAAMETPPVPASVQLLEGPNGFTEPTPPAEETPAQQLPLQPGQPYYPTARPPIVYQAPVMDRGISPGAANAFTRGSTERPIPANFGPVAQVPNAFNDGNTAMVTYTPAYPNPMYPQRPTMARGPVPGQAVAGNPLAQGVGGTPQLLGTLKDSLLPSEREAAAETLGTRDWHTQPQIADALVKAAKDDPAPRVRAECLRSLAHLGVKTLPAVTVCQVLKADPDPSVRKEAELALSVLGNANAIHPVSLTAPK